MRWGKGTNNDWPKVLFHRVLVVFCGFSTFRFVWLVKVGPAAADTLTLMLFLSSLARLCVLLRWTVLDPSVQSVWSLCLFCLGRRSAVSFLSVSWMSASSWSSSFPSSFVLRPSSSSGLCSSSSMVSAHLSACVGRLWFSAWVGQCWPGSHGPLPLLLWKVRLCGLTPGLWWWVWPVWVVVWWAFHWCPTQSLKQQMSSVPVKQQRDLSADVRTHSSVFVSNLDSFLMWMIMSRLSGCPSETTCLVKMSFGHRYLANSKTVLVHG